MRVFFFALSLLAAASVSSAALAQDWYRLGVSPDQTSVVFADAESVNGAGATIRSAWFDTYYDPARRTPFGSESSQDHDEFDCAARSIRVLTSLYFRSDGTVSKVGQPDATPFPVRPDTVGEAKLLFACTADHGGVDRFMFSLAAPNPREAARAVFAAAHAEKHGRSGR